MNKLGLLGYPLGHSRSPEKWNARFKNLGIDNSWSYSLFEVAQPENVLPFLKSIDGLKGFNITIPYKEFAVGLCQKLSTEAQSIGAVNTIKVTDSGEFWGFNTDAPALKVVIESFVNEPKGKSALILGTGGSSKAAIWACKSLGILFTLVSRTGSADTISYIDLTDDFISQQDIIIQATPIGMYPKTDEMPQIQVNGFRKGQFLIDLIYNPEVTLLMQEASKRGVEVTNGMQMLEIQADLAWEIFKG